MEFKIDKELVIMYLEKYYREQLDFNGNVIINLVLNMKDIMKIKLM